MKEEAKDFLKGERPSDLGQSNQHEGAWVVPATLEARRLKSAQGHNEIPKSTKGRGGEGEEEGWEEKQLCQRQLRSSVLSSPEPRLSCKG